MTLEKPYAGTVTTLDLLKTAAVVLMVLDHVGLYLAPDPWLRIVGRGAAIIFGFLLGFSGATRVPPTWIALGLGLTMLDGVLDTGDDDSNKLDILITLALTRIVLPFFEWLHGLRPLLLAPAAALLALAAEPLSGLFDYGPEITMVALLGLAVRLSRGQPGAAAARDTVALVAIVGMSLVQLRHFKFEGVEALGCVAVIAATLLVLARFQKRELSLVAAVRGPVRVCGRYTLWIYAGHLALFQIIAWAGDLAD